MDKLITGHSRLPNDVSWYFISLISSYLFTKFSYNLRGYKETRVGMIDYVM